MLLQLTNGQTIIAEKKCNCKNHSGPHWIYLNTVWKEKNNKIKGLQHTVEEIKRLKRWERVLQDNGVLNISGY